LLHNISTESGSDRVAADCRNWGRQVLPGRYRSRYWPHFNPRPYPNAGLLIID